jgi:hypothetical protein
MTRLDAFDDSVTVSFGPDPNAIPGRDDVPLIGAEGLEKPPGGTAAFRSVVARDMDDESLHAKNSSQHTDRAVDLRQDHLAGCVLDDLAAGHGPSAGEVPLAGDAF